jgi:pimeloyl-ACP methyl ester carboxylesterase
VSDIREDVTDYDEFEALEGYANWARVPWDGRPAVRRISFEITPTQRLSMLAWYGDDPEIVFLHGGGQNAHTWDTVVMALARPALAVDLPGHGHSSWREDRDYWPWSNADAIATMMERQAPNAKAVVGMSLGGLTTIRLSAMRPDLVPRAVIVDVTPGVGARQVGMTVEDRGAVAVMQGSPEYESFDAMLAELAKTMPNRPVESLIPGLRHNAKRREDGKWVWRHDLMRSPDPKGQPDSPDQPGTNRLVAFESLWDDLATVRQPIMLVKGGASKFVHDDDATRFADIAKNARVEIVYGAGHSIQSDRPVQLASLIESHVGIVE